MNTPIRKKETKLSKQCAPNLPHAAGQDILLPELVWDAVKGIGRIRRVAGKVHALAVCRGVFSAKRSIEPEKKKKKQEWYVRGWECAQVSERSAEKCVPHVPLFSVMADRIIRAQHSVSASFIIEVPSFLPGS
jgi:hypothetical protein